MVAVAQEWLSLQEAARIVGVSPQAVAKRLPKLDTREVQVTRVLVSRESAEQWRRERIERGG